MDTDVSSVDESISTEEQNVSMPLACGPGGPQLPVRKGSPGRGGSDLIQAAPFLYVEA